MISAQIAPNGYTYMGVLKVSNSSREVYIQCIYVYYTVHTPYYTIVNNQLIVIHIDLYTGPEPLEGRHQLGTGAGRNEGQRSEL